MDKLITSITPARSLAWQAEKGLDVEWIFRIHPEEILFKGRTYSIIKRFLDLTVVLFSLPFLLPLMLCITCSIKILSPGGPAIFTQWRTGKGGKRFRMYKFRTMVPNAEELKSNLSDLNELQWPDFKITNDPRVTPLGRILRSTSFDELPQLLNVLKGEMSLVGPRPTSIVPENYTRWQTKRFAVLPGITGLWQVTGRGSIEFDSRIRLDIAYIDHRCLWLDIQILLRTVTCVLSQKGRT